MTKDQFVTGRNVVVFEHLMVDRDLRGALTSHLADPLDDSLAAKVRGQLGDLVRQKIEKYNDADLKPHIKLIYLFLTEGMQGMASGQTLAEEEEKSIKQAFRDEPRPEGFPALKIIGITELRPILAQVEARVPGIKLSEFLLRKDGQGGYDTPKIASALIQLARRDYVRQEMFIRTDDDVWLNGVGVRALKDKYYDLVHDAANRYFCISWNYEATPLTAIVSTGDPESDYERLFEHFVNSYSIRTTFLGDPSSRCDFDLATGRLLPLQPNKNHCRLNLVHTKYFIDLFKEGRWGSSLEDPISGAGMCFSADSLSELPPWCNADELITWIDDFVKWQLLAAYFGDAFARDLGLLRAENSAGFQQHRNDPAQFSHGDVAWSTNTYLDRLVMGCIISYCIDPTRYGDDKPGFGELLKEHDHLTALRRWRGGFAAQLEDGAQEHARKVLRDWHHFFCAKAGDSQPAYLETAPQPPSGFVTAPATTCFNAYSLKQLLAIDQGTFDLAKRVLHVLERYMELKYRFWPHVVETIDVQRTVFQHAQRAGTVQDFFRSPTGWLFAELDKFGAAEDRPTTRVSRASVALISAEDGDNPRWLMQWNSTWQVMNFISGHKTDEDPNDLACMLRELHEELFGELPSNDLARMYAAVGNTDSYDKSASDWQDPFIESVTPSVTPPHELRYVGYSESAAQWSQYELTIYNVRLTEDGWNYLFRPNPFLTPEADAKPEGPNEWVSAVDVRIGWTKMGRPISPTVRRVF